jgi:hypothetical protein
MAHRKYFDEELLEDPNFLESIQNDLQEAEKDPAFRKLKEAYMNEIASWENANLGVTEPVPTVVFSKKPIEPIVSKHIDEAMVLPIASNSTIMSITKPVRPQIGRRVIWGGVGVILFLAAINIEKPSKSDIDRRANLEDRTHLQNAALKVDPDSHEYLTLTPLEYEKDFLKVEPTHPKEKVEASPSQKVPVTKPNIAKAPLTKPNITKVPIIDAQQQVLTENKIYEKTILLGADSLEKKAIQLNKTQISYGSGRTPKIKEKVIQDSNRAILDTIKGAAVSHLEKGDTMGERIGRIQRIQTDFFGSQCPNFKQKNQKKSVQISTHSPVAAEKPL